MLYKKSTHKQGTLKMKKDVGVALRQKPLKLAECRNVGMLTGQG